MLICTAYPADGWYDRFGDGWDQLEENQGPNGECPEVCKEFQCFNMMSACENQKCPGYPNATCIVNYCTGCNHYFVDDAGDRIVGVAGCGTCADPQ